jgi:ABC-type Fe2+-enterobactin transport system substrate-binding protein
MGDRTVSDLGKKRLDTTLAIATYALGSATASAAPTPGGEIPKQILLTASDVLMYTRIWRIYFEEDLSSKSVVEMLTELGLVSAVGAGSAYVISKATTAILKEIANWTGPIGWGITAAIAGSLSGLFGAAWALYCDNLYNQKHPQPVEG